MDGKLMLADAVGPRADCVGAPAKVPVPEVGTEEPVIGKERWEEIRRMRAEGQAVSQIARATGLDRKTVRRCLRQSQWTPYRRTPMAETLLSAHMGWLAERAPQVNFSAQILFQELRASRGYGGGYDTVRNAVRPLRTEAAAAALTQRRFETEPGQQAQVDWGQVRTRFVSGPAEVHVFVMTLGYSRRAWAEGYQNERLAALLAAHEHAFAHFGGLHGGDPLRPHAHGHPGHHRGQAALESDLRGLRPALGVRAAAVPTLPGADQGQGRERGEVREAQLPPRADVPRPRGLQRAARRLAHRDRRRARARHHARAADRSLRRRSRRPGAGGEPAELPAGDAPRADRGRGLARLDRLQPLLGALAPDRQDRPGRARRRSLADPAIGASSSPSTRCSPDATSCGCCPEHGPGAAARNARKRFSDAPPTPTTDPRAASAARGRGPRSRGVRRRCWRPHEPRPARTARRAPAEAAPVQEPRAARSAAAGGRRQGARLLGLPRAGALRGGRGQDEQERHHAHLDGALPVRQAAGDLRLRLPALDRQEAGPEARLLPLHRARRQRRSSSGRRGSARPISPSPWA